MHYSHTAGTYFRWHNLAIGLKQLGNEIDVYAGDYNWRASIRNEIRDGINYFIIPALPFARFLGNGTDPFSGIRRLFHLPKTDYDVYHLFQPYIQAYIPWRYLKFRKQNAVFLYDWDDLWTDGLFSAKPKGFRERATQATVGYLERNIPNEAKGVSVCSQFLADRLEPSVTTNILYNGFWPRPPQYKGVLKQKWRLEPDIFYLAYVGRTAQEMSWIAQAFDLLLKNGFSKVRLIVCGPTKQLLQELNMLDRNEIHYLGELSPEDSFEICAVADLGLVPLENSNFNKSRFPIKFFDFLSAGTPVYLSNVGEIGKIGSSIDGAFIGANTKKEWSDDLGEVIISIQQNNPRIDISQLQSSYAWPTVAKNMMMFYLQIFKSK